MRPVTQNPSSVPLTHLPRMLVRGKVFGAELNEKRLDSAALTRTNFKIKGKTNCLRRVEKPQVTL